MEQYDKFLNLLSVEDKEGAVRYALEILERGEMDVPALYEQVVGPSLKNMACSLDNKQWCIWREHIRTGIVRSVIECCIPYVMKERRARGLEGKGKVVLGFAVVPTDKPVETIRADADPNYSGHVMIRSKEPSVTRRAMSLAVANSPCALNCCSWMVLPAMNPRFSRPRSSESLAAV